MFSKYPSNVSRNFSRDVQRTKISLVSILVETSVSYNTVNLKRTVRFQKVTSYCYQSQQLHRPVQLYGNLFRLQPNTSFQSLTSFAGHQLACHHSFPPPNLFSFSLSPSYSPLSHTSVSLLFVSCSTPYFIISASTSSTQFFVG